MFSKIFQTASKAFCSPLKQCFSTKKPTHIFQQFKEHRSYSMKRFSYLNVALSCFVFAACFAGIPLYRTFCQHMGLVGDKDKKEYNFKDTKINNMKKFKVVFTGDVDPDIKWDFEPIEKEVIVGAGETAIVFYRLFNREEKPIVGFAIYNISPEDVNTYFSKIQCFCFNQQLINPQEELLLPLFFYLQPELLEDTDVSRVDTILVAYTFLKSAKQNLAKFAEEEIKRVETNKQRLNQIRAKKMNMTIDEYLDHLDKEEAQKELQAEQKKDEEIQILHKQEIERIKRIKDFENDVLKAELISKQFDIAEDNPAPRAAATS